MTHEKHIGYTSIDNILNRYYPNMESEPLQTIHETEESIVEPKPVSIEEVPEVVYIKSPSSSSVEIVVEDELDEEYGERLDPEIVKALV